MATIQTGKYGLHSAASSTPLAGSGTRALEVSFNKDVVVSSLAWDNSDSGYPLSAQAVVYRANDQAVVAKGPFGSVDQSNPVASFSSPVRLTAGVRYRLGVYISASGGAPYTSGITAATGLSTADHTHTSTGTDTSLVMTVHEGYCQYGGNGYPADASSSTLEVTFDTITVAAANAAPNAPTLTSLVGGEVIDRANVNRASHSFSDPDSGDSQSAFDHRYRLVGAPSWTSAYTATPNQFVDYPAGTFAAGDYERQVRTYDSQGVAGPWSPSSFFTAADAPAALTITAPVNGGTVSSSETVTWSAPNEDAYELRRVRDNAGTADTATVYYDTGEVVTTTARSRPVTFETNNRYEHVQVRIKVGGLWSSWASVRVLVSFTPPGVPTLTVALDSDMGLVSLAISNPTPGAGEPSASYNNIYARTPAGVSSRDFHRPHSEAGTRIAAEKPLNSTHIDWTPAALLAYEYRVEAVADNGAVAYSAWTSIDPQAAPTIYYGGGY